jgi:hypothetical protein
MKVEEAAEEVEMAAEELVKQEAKEVGPEKKDQRQEASSPAAEEPDALDLEVCS